MADIIPVDNPGVNEALTHEVIHCGVEIKTVKIRRDAAALILKHAYIILHVQVRHDMIASICDNVSPHW